MSEPMQRISEARATELAIRALEICGASPAAASSLAVAAVDADRHGHHTQGLDHLDVYCDGLIKGRIDGKAEPVVEQATPVVFNADARFGIAHLPFDMAFERLVAAAKQMGIAAYSSRNTYTCGELGWFVRRLACEGLAGFATTNAGPPLLAGAGGTKPVFCTNPLAFAAPAGEDGPLLLDQSCSSAAFTNIRHAAAMGGKIPFGWALDDEGQPTDDPNKAIEGVLLAFGGDRGANLALLVEIFSVGLSGGNWSLDAPAFHEGEHSPGVGQFVLAINPEHFAAPDFEERLGSYLDRLHNDYDVYIPGRRKLQAAEVSNRDGISVPERVIARLQGIVDGKG